MFLDVKDLAVRKLPIHKSYAPGSIDYHSSEIKQVAPLDANATAELFDGDIRIDGHLETKVELSCARCLEPVVEEVSRDFDLSYTPLPKQTKPEEERLKDDESEIAFFSGEGLFLADVLRDHARNRPGSTASAWPPWCGPNGGRPAPGHAGRSRRRGPRLPLLRRPGRRAGKR